MRLTRSVLVVDLDVFGIFLPDRNKWHLESFVSVRDSLLVLEVKRPLVLLAEHPLSYVRPAIE